MIILRIQGEWVHHSMESTKEIYNQTCHPKEGPPTGQELK